MTERQSGFDIRHLHYDMLQHGFHQERIETLEAIMSRRPGGAYFVLLCHVNNTVIGYTAINFVKQHRWYQTMHTVTCPHSLQTFRQELHEFGDAMGAIMAESKDHALLKPYSQ